MAIVNTIKTRAAEGLKTAVLTLFLQRDRWVHWLPVPFALGICTYFVLRAEPSPWMAGPVLALLVFGLLARRRHTLGWLAMVVAALFAAGFAAAQWRTLSLDTVMLAREAGPLNIEARVAEVDALPKALRLTLTDTRLAGGRLYPGEILPPTIRVRLKAKDPTEPRAGDIVQVRAMLLPLSAPVLPGAFDFQRHAYFYGLGATGYAIGDVSIVMPLVQGGDIFENMRHGIRKKIEAGIEDREIAATVTAFLIGETKGISEPAWDIIRRAGIAHLLAISGFHITVVTGAFFFLVRALLALWPWAALHWPIKKISAGVAMAGSIFYLLLIGSPISAERAVIMACIVMLAIMLDRDPFSLRLAAFAALILLTLQPEALIGPSFQMSFAAVVALIAFYEGAARRWLTPEGHSGIGRKAVVYLVACLLTTVIATLATAPYTLYHFGQVPFLAGLAANMIAVPLSSLVTLPFGILACLLMPFGLDAAPLWVTEQSMILIMQVADTVAAWPHAVVRVNSFSSLWLALFTLGGLWVCIWRGNMRWLGLLPALIAVLGVVSAPRAVVMAADNGQLVGLRDTQERIWLSSLRREKFVAEAWLEREGAWQRNKAAGDWKAAQEEGVVRCDSRACLFDVGNGAVVSIVTEPEAVTADCGTVDLFIAPQEKLDADLCPKKRSMMIDQYDLRYGGAHAVYAEQNGFLRIKKVSRERGKRPWVPDLAPRQ